MKWLAVGLILSAACVSAVADCPTTSPTLRMAIQVEPFCGYDYAACATGTYSFSIISVPTEPWPWIPYQPGYRVQPCDTVAWSFGDGSPDVTLVGTSATQHTFTRDVAENLTITATVTNRLGSVTLSRPLLVADDPVTITIPKVTLVEHDGFFSVALHRAGGMGRSVSLRVRTSTDMVRLFPYSTSLTFAPGETSKSIQIPMRSDSMYQGRGYHSVYIDELKGGIVPYATGSIEIRDDEPQPVLSIDDLVVTEGNGITEARFTIRLTGPIGSKYRVNAYTDWRSGDASYGVDFKPNHDGVWLEPGQLSGTMTVQVLGDTMPERDEVLYVRLREASIFADPKLEREFATCTILNDDTTLDPPGQTVPVGARGILTLDLGTALGAPAGVIIQTEGSAVQMPATVAGAAGELRVAIPFSAAATGTTFVGAHVPTARGPVTADARIDVVEATSLTCDVPAVTAYTGQSVVLHVSLTPPSVQPQFVSLAWSGIADVRHPPSVIIPPGGSAPVTIEALRHGSGGIVLRAPAILASFWIGVDVNDPPPIRIDTIAPQSGPASGGTAVDVRGAGLDSSCTVFFGSAPAIVVGSAANAITAITAAHAAGPVDVEVRCPAGHARHASAFIFTSARRRPS